jgi:hypothetical protein
MSKKKNTLKDLDAFLKQQAATLVSPTRLQKNSEHNESPVFQESPVQNVAKDTQRIDEIVAIIKNMSGEPNFRSQLCDIILGSLSEVKTLKPEDKILINTALYLKHGERWKDAIRDFWSHRHE